MASQASTGLRVGGNAIGANWFEVSVPTFINGDNRQLITSEAAFQAAKTAIADAVNQVCELDSTSIRFTRIDLVQYVPIPLQEMIMFHRAGRHPKFHKGPTRWNGESIVFNGRGRKCRMYSPELKRGLDLLPSTRVEWELHNPALRVDFGGNIDWEHLRLDECYKVYRNLCLEFDCTKISKVGSIYHFLALGEFADWQYDGIPALEYYLRGMTKASANRLRQKVAAHRTEFFKFSWSELLPSTYPEFLALSNIQPAR